MTDEGLAFMVCTGATARLREVRVFVATRDENGQWGEPEPYMNSIFVANRPKESSVSDQVSTANPFVIGQPVPGLEFETLRRLDATRFNEPVGVQVSFSDDENGKAAWVSFPATDLAELPEGKFLYSDGTLSTEPCDMFEPTSQR